MIRFSSAATGDVNMLDEHAAHLLEAIGKTRGERGVITAEEIPAALAALRAAIAGDAPRHARPEDTDDPDERQRREHDVDLGRRAYPLIDMLERAVKNNKEITWGV
jgi:cyclopropane-fatty-acyl-phospholipid synthase